MRGIAVVLIAMVFLFSAGGVMAQSVFYHGNTIKTHEHVMPIISEGVRSIQSHLPIKIYGDGDFNASNGVIAGNGSKESPYIISGWSIDSGKSGADIYIMNTTAYFIVENCTLKNGTSGIFLGNVKNGIVRNNTVYGNTNGIVLVNTSYSQVINNSVMYNNATGLTGTGGNGISITSSFEDYVGGNNVSKNSNCGVILERSYNNTLVNNSVYENEGSGIFLGGGITIYSSKFNMLYNNSVLYSAANGIYLFNSSSNQVLKNWVRHNYMDGIVLSKSSENRVTGNNIVSNGNFGIDIISSEKIYMENNTLYFDSVYISGDNPAYWGTHDMINNTVNGKAVEYISNMMGVAYSGSAGEVIVANSSNVEISGVNATRADVGILVGDSKNLEIGEANISYCSHYGVYLSNVNNVSISNVSSLGYEKYSLYGFGVKNVSVSGSIFEGEVGIEYEQSSNVSVSNNSFVSFDTAVEFLYSNDVGVKENTVKFSKIGMYFEGTGEGNVSLNRITALHGGIYLVDSMKFNVVGNVLFRGGLILSGDNVSYWNSHIIVNNTVNKNEILYLKDISYKTINGTFGEVIMAGTTHVKIDGANVVNGSGIIMGFSSYNYIVNSNISENRGDGIYLSDGSDCNVIENNTFYNNTEYGVAIYQSRGNTVFLNYFYLNSGTNNSFKGISQSLDDGWHNFWNSSSGIGNYWRDWALNNDTNDENHDGFVDWPYSISGSSLSRDMYPLKVENVSNVLTHPENLRASYGDSYVNLTWSPPAYAPSEILWYTVYRNGVAIANVSGAQLWYNDTNVVNGETYTYYITASVSGGVSEGSNVVLATPVPSVPEFSLFFDLLFVIFVSGFTMLKKKV